MKILNSKQIAHIDEFTIKNTPVSSVDLMKKAADKCSEWIIENTSEDSKYDIFAGVGNNGGDALVVAIDLLSKGRSVNLYVVDFTSKWSDDFKHYFNIVSELIEINFIEDTSSIPDNYSKYIVDGIFGVGLNRPAEGFVSELIKKINSSKSEVIAIDMPSGLYADKALGDSSAVVKANYTLTFQLPKLNLLLPNYALYTGHLEILDIGLIESEINKQESFYYYTTEDSARKILKNRSKFSHKGNYGHSLLIGGSKGKIGAITLATRAAVKSGSGLVSALVPSCAYDILQISVPEAMVLNEGENHLEKIYFDIDVNAIGIGPGFGTVVGCKGVLKDFLEENRKNLVIDADAINIISHNRELLNLLPENSIITPHPKEFERLVGEWSNDYEKLKLGSEFAMNYQCYIVLKGAHTAIITPEGNIYFNSTGNPGMATGGSGDVLTGVITALLAQNYAPLDACILGVYLHGKAADLCIETKTESFESLSATNIIDFLGPAFVFVS